jgi:hypothetical protein
MRYSAAVIVGLPYHEIVKQVDEESEVAVYNRFTGEPDGTEKVNESHFFLGNRELPDDESPELTLTLDHGLDRIPSSDSEFRHIYGRSVKVVSGDNPNCLAELNWLKVGAARAEVVRVFRELGIETEPKVYLALYPVEQAAE